MMLSPTAPEKARWAMLYAAWTLALIASLGAMFIEVVMHLPPCDLCWWQRIFMFPLVPVLGFGLLVGDLGSVRSALALVVPGAGVAGYHTLLFAGIVPAPIVPCSQGVSCTDASMSLLGLPLPLISLIAFLAIGLLLIAALKGHRQ